MGFLIAAIIILLILSLRISVRISAEDETALWVGVGFIKIPILPTKEKSVKLRDYEIKRFRKLNPPETESDPKADEAAKKAKDDKKKRSKQRKNTEIQLGKREKTDVPALIKKLVRVLGVFLKRFGKHLRVDARRIVVLIATGDAASTAILYGAVIGAVQNLFAILTTTGTLRTHADTEIIVDTDFLSEKSTVKIDLSVSFRIWHFFDMAIRAGIEFLKKEK